MTLDGRIEALVAVGASVAANCVPCLQANAREAEARGASAEEIAAAIALGQRVRKGAATRMDQAVAALASPAPAAPCCG